MYLNCSVVQIYHYRYWQNNFNIAFYKNEFNHWNSFANFLFISSQFEVLINWDFGYFFWIWIFLSWRWLMSTLFGRINKNYPVGKQFYLRSSNSKISHPALLQKTTWVRGDCCECLPRLTEWILSGGQWGMSGTWPGIVHMIIYGNT